MMIRRCWAILPVCLLAFASGCGGEGRYRVSGKVTFKGAPVPAGKIYFIPDGSKGNTGPTGFADIKDGVYDTSAKGGMGAPGGAVTIAVEGLDPSAPADKPAKGVEASEESKIKVLFARYEMKVDLPKSASTKDIEVPADAAKGPVNPTPTPGKVIP